MLIVGLNKHKNNGGFTIIELLISLLISSLIGLVVIRVMSTASNVLAVSADGAIAAQQAIRLASVLNYDVAGANSLTIYSYTATVSGTGCNKQSIGTHVGTTPIVSNIALVSIASPTTSGRTFATKSDTYVSYQIRRASGGTSQPYELWRIKCESNISSETSAEKITKLGLESWSNPNGTSVFRCSGPIAISSRPDKTVSFSNGTYTFDMSTTTGITASSGWTVYSANDYSIFMVGSISNPIGSNVSLPSPSPSPLSMPAGAWIFTKDCVADTNILANSKFVLVNLPYSGKRDSLDAQAPLLLTNRVGR